MQEYEILHLKPGASLAEIQQAYRDLVRVWHPDRFAKDPRLQKIADQKLREINAAYLALETALKEPPVRAEAPPRPASPPGQPWYSGFSVHSFSLRDFPLLDFHGWAAWRPSARWLWLAAAVTVVAAGGLRIYELFEAPLSALEQITADARRVAAWNGPSLVNAFEGWNGVLPQGLDRLIGFYQSAPVPGRRDVAVSRLPTHPPVRSVRTAPPVEPLPGVGEIQIHNQTGEDAQLVLTSARIRSAALRRITSPPEGIVTLSGLGPDIYRVQVSFPRSQRAEMRLGPFVMVETETAAGASGDRYEVTLKRESQPN